MYVTDSFPLDDAYIYIQYTDTHWWTLLVIHTPSRYNGAGDSDEIFSERLPHPIMWVKYPGRIKRQGDGGCIHYRTPLNKWVLVYYSHHQRQRPMWQYFKWLQHIYVFNTFNMFMASLHKQPTTSSDLFTHKPVLSRPSKLCFWEYNNVSVIWVLLVRTGRMYW